MSALGALGTGGGVGKIKNKCLHCRISQSLAHASGHRKSLREATGCCMFQVQLLKELYVFLTYINLSKALMFQNPVTLVWKNSNRGYKYHCSL